MPKVLTLCGSTLEQGSTALFLRAFQGLAQDFEWAEGPNLGDIPLFTPKRESEGRPATVSALASAVLEAEAIIIATPEYAHNLPAALKNAFEWLVASGEFSRKRVLAITATPNEPRGEYCMKSMCWTLQALDAQVLSAVSVYDVASNIKQGQVMDDELREVMLLCCDLIRG